VTGFSWIFSDVVIGGLFGPSSEPVSAGDEKGQSAMDDLTETIQNFKLRKENGGVKGEAAGSWVTHRLAPFLSIPSAL
jgi:hypothetical protein